jgi:hypothetical protein
VYGEFVQQVVAEFVDIQIPDDAILEPYTMEQVLESQKGKFQQHRNGRVMPWLNYFWDLVVCVRSMLKLESLSGGATRNISTLRPEINLRLGRFTLALSKHLLNSTDWYMAGRKPADISLRLWALLEGRDQVACADVSKMDACKNIHLTAQLLIRMMLRAFGDDERDEIYELRVAEALAIASTASNQRYVAMLSQLSGSAGTSLDNTLVNAFISYLSNRLGGEGSVEASSNLGLFCGDDSVTRSSLQNLYQAAKMLGYTLTVRVVERGGEIDFLSRFFPNIWDGCLGSYQDIIRLLRKAHVSFSDKSLYTPQQMACGS